MISVVVMFLDLQVTIMYLSNLLKSPRLARIFYVASYRAILPKTQQSHVVDISFLATLWFNILCIDNMLLGVCF